MDFIYYPKSYLNSFLKLFIVTKNFLYFIISFFLLIIKVVIYFKFKLGESNTYKISFYIYNSSLKLF